MLLPGNCQERKPEPKRKCPVMIQQLNRHGEAPLPTRESFHSSGLTTTRVFRPHACHQGLQQVLTLDCGSSLGIAVNLLPLVNSSPQSYQRGNRNRVTPGRNAEASSHGL